jgi:diaminopimelate decarboxylase
MPSPPTFGVQRNEIAGLGVVDLATQFGTPTYVYDAAKIAERIHDLASFDAVRFAQKANSNLAVLDWVRQHGAVVDAVSGGEINRAFAAGFAAAGDPPGIVYTADIFDTDVLKLVVDRAIHVNCGSPDMIEQYGAVAPGRNITLRINPGFGHGHSQKTNTGGEQSKHGIWHEQLERCLQRADHHGLCVTGLHMHIGSGTDLEHLAQVCSAMESAALTAGRMIKSISAGGGLPTPYQVGDSHIDLDRYFQLWDQTRTRLQDAFGHQVMLEVEPGRYLTAESGYLITEIRAIKQMGANTFYLVDAGFNNLARPILYGAYHPMSIAAASGELDRPLQDVIVGGPLCESGDIFTQKEGGYVCTRSLPVASVGDLLVIECAGAYCSVMASNYNSKTMAAEVMIRDGQPHRVRARQTYEDLIRGESIPE